MDEVITALTDSQGRLFGYIYLQLGQREVAQDILQETNLYIWKNIAHLDSPEHFWPWAKTMAAFQIRRYIKDRANERKAVVFDSQTADAVAENLADPAGEDRSELSIEALESCLGKLPPDKRALVNRRYWDCRSLNQIAREDSAPQSTVAMRFLRIRQELIDCIRHFFCHFGDDPSPKPGEGTRAELLESAFDGDGASLRKLAARMASDPTLRSDWLTYGALHAALLFDRDRLGLTVARPQARPARSYGWLKAAALLAVLLASLAYAYYYAAGRVSPAKPASVAPAAVQQISQTTLLMPTNAPQPAVASVVTETTQAAVPTPAPQLKQEETNMNIRTVTAVVTSAVALAAVTVPRAALAADNSVNGTWTGAASNNLWVTAGNWENSLVPSGSVATATFPAGTSGSIQLPAAAVEIGTLVGPSGLALATVSNGTFTLTDASGFGGSLTLGGGSLVVNGTTVLDSLGVTADASINVADASATVSVSRVTFAAALSKVGPGTLRLPYTTSPSGSVALVEGQLAITHSALVEKVLNQSWFHVDASQTNTFELFENGGTNFISKWNDVRGNGVYATPPNTDIAQTSAPHAPWLAPDYQNGLPVVDFGLYAGPAFMTNGTAVGLDHRWGGCLNWSKRQTNVLGAFIVFEDGDECSSIATDFAWPFFIGDTSTYEFHRGGNANLFGDTHASVYLRNGTNTIDGNVVTFNAAVPAGFHVIGLRPTGAVTASTFANDRARFRYGGVRIAEAVICTNAVTAEESALVSSYFSSKWQNVVADRTFASPLKLAGGTLVIPEGEAVEVGDVAFEGAATLTGGGTLRIGTLSNDAGSLDVVSGDVVFTKNAAMRTPVLPAINIADQAIVRCTPPEMTSVTKGGAGTLLFSSFGTNAAENLTVREGVLRVSGLSEDVAFHVDASRSETLGLFANGGTNFISRWDDSRFNGLYATPPNTDIARTSAPHAPWLAPNYQNGLPVVDFGLYAGKDFKTNGTSVGVERRWGGCLNWSNAQTNILGAFIVFEDGDECSSLITDSAWPFFIGDTSTYEFHRGGNANLFGDTHASVYLRNGTNTIDGNVVTFNAAVPAGFHVIGLRPTGAVKASTFANDRALFRYGGVRIAEAVICTNVPDDASASAITTYLERKWLSNYTIGEDAPHLTLGDLAVASGATLDLGLSPASVAPSTAQSLSGAGTVKTVDLAVDALSPGDAPGAIGALTVSGDLTIADGARLTLNVASDGTADSLAVSGVLTVAGGCRVALNAADPANLTKACTWVIATADGGVDAFTNLQRWKFTGNVADRYIVKARVQNDSHRIVLSLESKGGSLELR